MFFKHSHPKYKKMSIKLNNLSKLFVCLRCETFRGGNSPSQAGGFFMPKRIGMAVPFNEPFRKVISPLESFAALSEHRFLVL